MTQTIQIDVTLTFEVDYSVYPPEPDTGAFVAYSNIDHITSPNGTSIDGDLLKALNDLTGGNLEEQILEHIDIDE